MTYRLHPLEPLTLSGKSSLSSPIPWTLTTISSGYYQHLRTSNQPWNARSADSIENGLGLFEPSGALRIRATPESPLTSGVLRDFVARLGITAKKTKSHLVVVYYIGHTLSWPNGDIALVLGEAEEIPEPKREYPREHTNDAISERFGANMGSLLELAEALNANSEKLRNANLEKLPSGYRPLRDLYAELDKIGIPFALWIDGCLRNDEFERFRNGLGLTSDEKTRSFFYTGPDGQLLSSIDAFESKLRHFADALPYLHTTNPVILAAKPGTFAQPWSDPDLDWADVGPLSARITEYVRASIWDQEPPPLEVLSNVTDDKGTGEISPKGSISRSDFAVVVFCKSSFAS